MKILVDCSTAKKGGAWTYLREFLKVLAKRQFSSQWIISGPEGFIRGIPPLPAHVEYRAFPRRWATPVGHLAWLLEVAPWVVRRERVDAFFAATGFGMLFPTCPQIVLVRNPIYYSELYEKQIANHWIRRLNLTLRRWISLRTIRSSAMALFPTRAMRDLVARHIALDSHQAVVAPYGCDVEFFRREPQDPHGIPQAIAQMEKRFLLNISLYTAQKNFNVLFKALGILRREGEIVPLVLTTRLSPQHSATFREDQKAIAEGGIGNQVIQLGAVAWEKLPALYQGAALFVFPSYAESFGHPLLEAMAAGLAILAADTPVNREICGSAAAYAPAFDPQAWALGIRRLLENPQECERLGKAASVRATCFSWEAHVGAVAQAAGHLQ